MSKRLDKWKDRIIESFENGEPDEQFKHRWQTLELSRWWFEDTSDSENPPAHLTDQTGRRRWFESSEKHNG